MGDQAFTPTLLPPSVYNPDAGNPPTTQFVTVNGQQVANPYYTGPATPATTPTPAPTPAATPPTPPPTTTGASGQQISGVPGSLSTTPGQQPGTTLTAAQMQAISNQNIANVTNPTLTASEKATPVNQTANANEMLSSQSVNASSDQVGTSEANIHAATVGFTAQAVNPTTGLTAAQYQANLVDPAQLAAATHAVTAALPPGALVSNQLHDLLTPDANGNLPEWIQPAITAANQLLQGRGISNSTMAGQAITAAILTASIPVATSNANAVLAGWEQNLTNEQQAAMQQGQAYVQGALSNQGAQNAALNFNATSENQTNQFLGSLASQINQFNASQSNAISQFNASQTQTAATNSAQLQAQLDQFNANMANQREQFNVQNAIIIQQSNAEYLRAVNTANTAVANQDNQLNAMNTMNLSVQSMANLQQEFNDNAAMLYNSNMTAEQQNYAMAYLATQFGLQSQLDQNITNMQQNAAQSVQLSNTIGSIVSPIAGALGNAAIAGITSLFTGSSNPVSTPGVSSGTNFSGFTGTPSTSTGDLFSFITG